MDMVQSFVWEIHEKLNVGNKDCFLLVVLVI